MWFFGWIICGVCTAALAVNKNKSFGKWLMVGLLLGPIALLVVGFSPADPVQDDRMLERGLRKCPFCAEAIKDEAIVCKHCGREIKETQQDRAQLRLANDYALLLSTYGNHFNRSVAQEALKNMGHAQEDIVKFMADK